MATQFEFRLIGAESPDGELEADQLIALVQSLKEVATKIGRTQTVAEDVGRPPKRTQRVAKLSVGLAPGSTRLLVRRAAVSQEELPIELYEESAFDRKFQSLIESIADDERPPWVSDTLAIAAGNLRGALEMVAPTVEFAAGRSQPTVFRTGDTHRETWLAIEGESSAETVTFVGRLRAVNLDTHRLQVTDDMGNKVALPNVDGDVALGHLLNNHVTVVGTPERDAKGRVSQIVGAVIEATDPLPPGFTIPETIALEEILSTAPTPRFDGLPELTDEEADAFFDALGL